MHFIPAVRRLALVLTLAVGAGGLAFAPATSAQAADEFGNLSISGLPASFTLSTDAATKVDFTVSFTGPTTTNVHYSPYDANTTYADAAALATNGATKVIRPVFTSPAPYLLVPGTQIAYTMVLNSSNTPGHYRLSVPVKMSVYDDTTGDSAETVQVATSDFDIIASPAVTLSYSSFVGGGKFSKKSKWTWQYDGPDYVRGATIKVYYEANGKKKYAVVASARLDASGQALFKGKKGALRKKGKVYYLLSAVPFSPVTRSGVFYARTK